MNREIRLRPFAVQSVGRKSPPTALRSLGQVLTRPAEALDRVGPLGLGLVIGLALTVRLLGIASRPIWYDEAFSVLFAEKGPAAMWAATFPAGSSVASEVHPLAYYVILWEWMRAFGESVVSVRLISVIAGVGAVVLMYALARGLFGRRTALAAGIIGGLAPFEVHYSQEIRMYVFLCLWLLLATYCCWRASRSDHWGWWLGFAAASALGVSTQYLAVFYLVPLAAWPALRRDWRTLRSLSLSAGLSLVLCLPWLIHLPGQLGGIHQVYWIERPELYRLFTLLLVYVTNLPLPERQLGIGLFLAVSVTAAGLLTTLHGIRSRIRGCAEALWLLYMAFVPAILLFVVSQWIPVYLERALLPSGAIFCIWLAWCLTEVHIPAQVNLVAALLLAAGFYLGLYQHLTYAGFPYGPFQEMVANLEARRQPGDAIVNSSKLSALPATYFDRLLPQTYIADPPGSATDTLAAKTREVLRVQAMPNIESAAGNAGRVWYVIFDESLREYVNAGHPSHPDLSWLMSQYQLSEVDHWGDLSIYLFSKARARQSPGLQGAG